MKKLIETYHCDYCGKECEHIDYVLPVIEYDIEYAKDSNGKKIVALDVPVVNPKNVDICPKCQDIIARFTRIMKYTDVKINEIEDSVFKAFINCNC